MDRVYVYDDDSYATLAAAEVGWQEANGALYGTGHKVTRHVGAHGLNIVAKTPGNGWLSMGFIETATNEVWLLTSIRRLSADESAKLDQMFEGGPS